MAEVTDPHIKLALAKVWKPIDLDHAREDLMHFGMVLKWHRQVAELSMRDLADIVDIRQDIISRVEHGHWLPSGKEEIILGSWMMQQSENSSGHYSAKHDSPAD